MSMGHRATCPCGFATYIEVGGTMRNYHRHSTFPFYCQHCGLVSVNIMRKTHVCPKCKSTHVVQYGLPPVSRPRGEDDYPVLAAWEYRAFGYGNYCPACGNMTLQFHDCDICKD